MSTAWDGGGPQPRPRGMRPRVHTVVLSGVCKDLKCAGCPPLRSLLYALQWHEPSPTCMLHCLLLENTKNRMLVLWPRLLAAPSPVGHSLSVVQRHETHLHRSAVKGTWPQNHHDQRPQAGVLSVHPSVTLSKCRTQPAATAVSGAPAHSQIGALLGLVGVPRPQGGRDVTIKGQSPTQERTDRGTAGTARSAWDATVGNGWQFLKK